jgi:hypothetical protein
MEKLKAVIVKEKSANAKIGIASTTYASQKSCPLTCPWLNKGCYAQLGLTGIHTNRLNKSGVTDIVEIAEAEATGIRGLTGQYHLRIHTVGDCTTNETAKIVAEAAKEHMGKQGMIAWTYTHAHDVDRESWGDVSVLRSCETIDQIKQATEDGYASVIVVDHFESEKPYDIGDGYVGIPCRNQVNKDITCVNCKLCLKDKNLHRLKRVILFEPHGVLKSKVKDTLNVLNS